jgi:hypothetical protein
MYLLFLSDFNQICILFKKFSKSSQIPNFVKIRPVEAELFHADGQTDKTKLRVAIRNPAKAPKK